MADLQNTVASLQNTVKAEQEARRAEQEAAACRAEQAAARSKATEKERDELKKKLNMATEEMWGNAISRAWSDCVAHHRSLLTGRCIP